jgi:hypothetical protein
MTFMKKILLIIAIAISTNIYAQKGSGRCEEQAGAISRKCTAADTQSGG